MNTKRLTKSLNRAMDQQVGLIVHDACTTIETEPSETIKRMDMRLTHLLQVEQSMKDILKL